MNETLYKKVELETLASCDVALEFKTNSHAKEISDVYVSYRWRSSFLHLHSWKYKPIMLSRMLQAGYNLPSVHNFSTSVSIFAFMIPTESPMRTKKPIARTTQQFRREKHPNLKKMAWSFERIVKATCCPIFSPAFHGRSREENSNIANIKNASFYCE